MMLSGTSCLGATAQTATSNETCKINYTEFYFNKKEKKIIEEINLNEKYFPIMQKIGRNIWTNSNVFK